MKSLFAALLFLSFNIVGVAHAQQFVDKTKFFLDTSTTSATLTLNVKKVMSKKFKEGNTFPASFACMLGDSLNVNDQINVEVRGHFRRNYCYLPPLKLIYKNNTANKFYHLKSLKLVSNCMPTPDDDQNLLKEFLIYKIYNLFTDKSFRVHLLNLKICDSNGKRTPVIEHAFLIEDVRELAKRTKCDDWSDRNFAQQGTDRNQTTLVSVFQYMIGNTDWSVPKCHNTRLLHSKADSLSRPYLIPYDFDFSGLVNTSYSIPSEKLQLENVRQRLYRGYIRTPGELNDIITVFNDKKTAIYSMINNFNLMLKSTKKEMTSYLDQFYETINDKNAMKEAFVTNSRQD